MVPKNICILISQQVESVEGDNAETPSYEYNLGIRAELEVKKSDLLRMICQLYNCKVFLPRFKSKWVQSHFINGNRFIDLGKFSKYIFSLSHLHSKNSMIKFVKKRVKMCLRKMKRMLRTIMKIMKRLIIMLLRTS